MDRKGKGMAKKKGIDLKRYFEVLGGSRSSSNSNPSTRESGNAPGQSVHQNQANTVETENANSLPSQQVEEEIPDSMEAIVEENVEVLGDEGTMQKELAKYCAMAVTKAIKEKMDGCLFTVLIDECRDISVKEQMVVVVRFLSKKGETIERFLGIKHVPDTTSASLKKALLEVFGTHGLLVAKLRGQGYDGASNMRGEFNGLQKLIRDENPYAFYIHCFAHQLQLVVVAVSRCCKGVEDFFEYVTMIVNVSGSSCRRKDKLLDKQKQILLDKIERVIEVLGIVEEDVRVPCRAGGLVHQMETFSFVFILKMMLKILRMTNDLSLLLQKKDQNVVQAMSLVTDVRTRLINWRNDGWEPLLEDVKAFCTKNEIPIPSMDDTFIKWGKSRKGGRNNVTADHFFRVDTFYVAIDSIITEFDHRFNERFIMRISLVMTVSIYKITLSYSLFI
ncbi:hypothetical protein ACQJBY_051940 [Aegilops geniculata]